MSWSDLLDAMYDETFAAHVLRHPDTHRFCRSRAANGQEDRASLHSGECVRQGEKWIASRWLQEQPTCGLQENLFVEE